MNIPKGSLASTTNDVIKKIDVATSLLELQVATMELALVVKTLIARVEAVGE